MKTLSEARAALPGWEFSPWDGHPALTLCCPPPHAYRGTDFRPLFGAAGIPVAGWGWGFVLSPLCREASPAIFLLHCVGALTIPVADVDSGEARLEAAQIGSGPLTVPELEELASGVAFFSARNNRIRPLDAVRLAGLLSRLRMEGGAR